jgi:hypothetical protein
MFAIIVTAKGGEQRRLAFDKPAITIGRDEENDVVLPDGDVSRQHARVLFESGRLVIVDLASTNGTYVNGRKIRTRRVIEEGDEISIGDFLLGVETSGASADRSRDVSAVPSQAASPWPGAFSYSPPVGHALPPMSGGAGGQLEGPHTQPTGVPPVAARQLVSIGLAHGSTPATPLPDTRTLSARGRYLLWVEIGPEFVQGALAGAAELPAVAAGIELDVVIFGFPGQLGVDPGHRRGKLRIAASGPAEVTRPAATPRGAGELGQRRLFFPIQAPRRPGRYSVRCNVYHRQLLLQSHLITVEVTHPAGERDGALQRVADYTLSDSLDVGRLAGHEPHRLSILLNDDGAGTHGFRFVGADDFVADASIDGDTLGALVDYARGALRRVAWGSTAPWRSPELDPYRYATPLPPAQLAEDLILLARHGYRLWSEALALFGVRGPERQKLRALMRTPGVVQLAIKENANHVFPAALLYDHPLDTGRDRLTLCQTAAAALGARAELETTACFAGRCPSHGDDTVVCPSGFWGFRHELGVPLHLGEKHGEVATEIVRGTTTRALIGVSTDPSFAARPAHVDRVCKLRALAEATILDERNECIQALEGKPPHLVYFFCHGGITASGTPYLEVGARKSEPITADLFTEIWWQEPRPLVVLNGCHTTAASPEQVFSMITAFVVQANAAGVVGTEITIFEPMAVSFGEELLGQFLAGETIGRAVRRARLALLRQGNPLGLAYIPFALSTLRLTATA